jgi:Carboxypeptidase regulatory-like domain/Calcineurin-like phosphoesterase
MCQLSRGRVCYATVKGFLLVGLALFSASLALAQASDTFTIIALPDTQIYSRAYPQIFRAQTQWIADNVASQNIKLVVGLGDIVDDGSSLTQWQNANSAISLLAGRVPYMLAIGNHDYDNNVPASRSAVYYNTFYGVSHYASQPWFRGSFPAGTTENYYGVFNINGQNYLIMMLEFFPRSAALSWASSVIEANQDKKVIIVTHAYEFDDNTRLQACYSDSAGSYGLTADNDGEEMWNKLAGKYSNVFMVLSGHIKVNDGVGRRADLGANGNLVNQVLADYQAYPEGGGGSLRIIKITPSQNKIDMSTYSPYHNTWKSDSQNQFTLDLVDSGGAAGTATIAGTVKSIVDCRRVGGVLVSYGGVSTTSDASGNFTLKVPVSRKFSRAALTAQRAGWGKVQPSVTAQAGATSNVMVFMSTSGRIVGRVTNGSGAGVAGAIVSLTGGRLATSKTVTADSSGAYSSGWVPVGSYSISVSATGFASNSSSATVSTGLTSTADVMLP